MVGYGKTDDEIVADDTLGAVKLKIGIVRRIRDFTEKGIGVGARDLSRRGNIGAGGGVKRGIYFPVFKILYILFGR